MFEPQFGSYYCWGWNQGYTAVNHANNTYSGYLVTAYLMAIDIEGYSGDGWSNAYQYPNRLVFNGFTDYVSGRTSQDPSHCNNTNTGVKYQYAVYSSPGEWSYSFGSYGTIGNTVEWTSEYCCLSSDPGSFTQAQWFGGSNYDVEWQFDENPDYDLAYEPIYMPVFGVYLGH